MQPTEQDPEPTRQLDADLAVAEWQLPISAPRRVLPPEDEGAPSWWAGDEDASQGFLRAMGVQLD